MTEYISIEKLLIILMLLYIYMNTTISPNDRGSYTILIKI